MIIKDIALSITLIAAVVVPTWLLIRASNKTRRYLTRELIRINKKLPEPYDIWCRRAVGIGTAKRLIFIDLHHKNEEVINLEDSKSCYLLLDGQKYAGGNINMKTADMLDLMVSYMGKTKKLNFYDSAVDDPVEGGQNIVMAKKWEAILKNVTKQPS